ncbi:MAG: NADH:ubiquinone reductase (Na(+)-transporting) subunit B [Bacteroidales bacterium]|nr:NADH:ubiquinone reductase (Na(+)-transporting) subunit B [Bacteroidales bacterium]
MKSLRRYLDKIKPHFEKGGKLEKLESTFEAFESFMFVPDKVTTKGTHIRDANDMKRTMAIVVLAVVPTVLFGMWNVGYQHFMATGQEGTLFELFWLGFLKVFPIIVVSYVVGLGIEFAFAQYRGHEVNEGFLVSGILIPLILPVDTPLWMVAVATAFAVIIGKEVFGGTGMNILNPALTARAFLFFAYPSYMSGNAVWTHGMMNGEGIIDSYTGATPLAEAAAGKIDNLPSVIEMFFGTIPGSIGETSTLAILIGAAILLFTGMASARIMISTFIGGLVMGLLLNVFAVNPFMEIPAWHHLLLGGFAFGAVFMATDPVSAAQTPKGKIIYGFLIGLFAILIRVINPAYPEGVMLAILLMNVFAPLIDHYVIEGNIKKRLKRAKT